MWLQDIIRAHFQIIQVPTPCSCNIQIKSMRIEVVAKNHLQPFKTMFLPQITLKILI